MQKRCRYREAYPAAYKAMLALSQAVEDGVRTAADRPCQLSRVATQWLCSLP